MNTKLKALALSASVLGGLAAAPAYAFVYADSSLLINNLVISVGGASAGSTATTFTFTNQNTAELNGASVIATKSCAGAPGAPGVGNNCTPGVGIARNNPAAANAPGGSAAATRGNLDFSFKGPGGGLQFSNSASSIDKSELLGDGPTATRQISESQLTSGNSASASALIQSITGFTFTFVVSGGPGSTLSINFMANPDQFAQISETVNGLFSAQSNMSASFTLRQTTGGTQQASWAPTGTAVNDCIASASLTCTETADGENLNATIGTNVNNTSVGLSHGDGVFSLFGLTIGGLTNGTYSLTLAATTSDQLFRTPIPEPETLLLLGAGIVALGFGSRRRQKKQAA